MGMDLTTDTLFKYGFRVTEDCSFIHALLDEHYPSSHIVKCLLFYNCIWLKSMGILECLKYVHFSLNDGSEG